MYSSLSNLILGFHGCDKETYDNVLYKHEELKTSNNDYDWLGNGMILIRYDHIQITRWIINLLKQKTFLQYYLQQFNL